MNKNRLTKNNKGRKINKLKRKCKYKTILLSKYGLQKAIFKTPESDYPD